MRIKPTGSLSNSRLRSIKGSRSCGASLGSQVLGHKSWVTSLGSQVSGHKSWATGLESDGQIGPRISPKSGDRAEGRKNPVSRFYPAGVAPIAMASTWTKRCDDEDPSY